MQAKTAGISKLLMIRLVPSFKLKKSHLYIPERIYVEVPRPKVRGSIADTIAEVQAMKSRLNLYILIWYLNGWKKAKIDK